MRAPGSPPDLLFRLIVPITFVFIVTILSMIAVLFGDERAPIVRFLNRYGNMLLLVEFLAVIAVSVMAMVIDRIRTLKNARRTDSAGNGARPDSSRSET